MDIDERYIDLNFSYIMREERVCEKDERLTKCFSISDFKTIYIYILDVIMALIKS